MLSKIKSSSLYFHIVKRRKLNLWLLQLYFLLLTLLAISVIEEFLANEIKLEEFVVCAKPNPAQIQELAIPASLECIEWSDFERAEIRSFLLAIFRKAPGLIINSGYKKKLVLVRCHTKNFIARANSGRILISDLFFCQKVKEEKEYYLTHELVHAADIGCTLAYSKPWVEFANAKIKSIRTTASNLVRPDRSAFENKLKTNKIWPSLYGAENLREALAECICAHLADKNYFPQPKFKIMIATLIDPTEETLEQRYLIKQIFQASCRKDYDHVILLSRALKQKYGDVATVSCMVANAYYKKYDYTSSLIEAKISARYFEQLKIDPNEDWYHRSLVQQSLNLQALHKYKEAIVILNKLIKLEPFNMNFQTQKIKCLEKSAISN